VTKTNLNAVDVIYANGCPVPNYKYKGSVWIGWQYLRGINISWQRRQNVHRAAPQELADRVSSSSEWFHLSQWLCHLLCL